MLIRSSAGSGLLSSPKKIEHPFLKPWLELIARGGGTRTKKQNVPPKSFANWCWTSSRNAPP